MPSFQGYQVAEGLFTIAKIIFELISSILLPIIRQIYQIAVAIVEPIGRAFSNYLPTLSSKLLFSAPSLRGNLTGVFQEHINKHIRSDAHGRNERSKTDRKSKKRRTDVMKEKSERLARLGVESETNSRKSRRTRQDSVFNQVDAFVHGEGPRIRENSIFTEDTNDGSGLTKRNTQQTFEGFHETQPEWSGNRPREFHRNRSRLLAETRRRKGRLKKGRTAP